MMKYVIRYLPLVLLFALGIVWGSGYVIARFAVTNGVPPLGYAFWQSLGPAILTLLFAFKQGQRVSDLTKHIPFYLICGLIGIALPNSIMYFAAAHVPAGLLAVIVNTVPIFIFPLVVLSGQESFRWQRLLAVMLGIIGIMLLVMPHEIARQLQWGYWPFLALLTPLSFAICAIYISSKPQAAQSSLLSAAGMLTASSLFLLPGVLMTHTFYPLWPPFNTAAWVVILEILLSSIGYVLFFYLLSIAGSVYYSMVGGVVSITGLLWGWLIFHERPTWLMLLAVSCILVAIIILSCAPAIKKVVDIQR